MLQHEKQDSACRREPQVGDTRLPIQPDAEARFVEVYATSRSPKRTLWGCAFHVIVGGSLPGRRVEVAVAVLVRGACGRRDGYPRAGTLLRRRPGRGSFGRWRCWRRERSRELGGGVLVRREVLRHFPVVGSGGVVSRVNDSLGMVRWPRER